VQLAWRLCTGSSLVETATGPETGTSSSSSSSLLGDDCHLQPPGALQVRPHACWAVAGLQRVQPGVLLQVLMQGRVRQYACGRWQAYLRAAVAGAQHVASAAALLSQGLLWLEGVRRVSQQHLGALWLCGAVPGLLQGRLMAPVATTAQGASSGLQQQEQQMVSH